MKLNLFVGQPILYDVISRKASKQIVSELDNRNLVEFWKQVYDIDISPDEIPLLKIKMLNSENIFTYPASMCYFAQESLYIPASVQKFIEYKQSRLIPRMYEVVKKAIKGLKIGDEIQIHKISDIYRVNDRENIQRQILEQTRQKLYGRNVHSWAQSCMSMMSCGSFQIKSIFLENACFYISDIFY